MRRGLLYAGTQHGVYISFDDGDRWLPFKNGLPDTPVADLVVEKNALAIGTHGRSFYVMDDIAALRQLGTRTAGGRDAVQAGRRDPRSRSRRHHLLPQGAAEEPDDRVPRRQGSGDALHQRAAAAEAWRQTGRWPAVAAAGFRGPQGAPMAAGVNRYTWDLNSTPVVSFPGHDPVGRDAERSDGAARRVHGAADGRRRDADAAVRRSPSIRCARSAMPICSISGISPAASATR